MLESAKTSASPYTAISKTLSLSEIEALYPTIISDMLMENYYENHALERMCWLRALKFSQAMSQPMWHGGSSPDGKIILVHGEAGLGDKIQFARYIPLLAAHGVTVIVQVPKTLLRLFSTLDGVSHVVDEDAALPHFDLHCPMSLLPAIFKEQLKTISSKPYLLTLPEYQRTWADRVEALSLKRMRSQDGVVELPKLRVGLMWRSNPALVIDVFRSISLESLRPLMLNTQVDFFALQQDIREVDQAAFAQVSENLVFFGADLQDFSDTAALCQSMDLIISVDTSVAHLAGALGKPLWLLLSAASEWRWIQDRHNNNPWYPRARIFRQKSFGDWTDVIEQVREALRKLCITTNCSE
jgi:hypothetical protein